MANSTSHVDNVIQGQSGKEITVNAYFDAASPAILYGRRQSTSSGLIFGYYGGKVLVNGVVTDISNGTLGLTESTTNYIEANPQTGSVSFNTTGFTAGRVPLYTVVTGASTVTSYTDHRIGQPDFTGLLVKAISDANTTLSLAEARNQIISITGTLTATRNIVLPLVPKQWTVHNGTNQSLQFIGATGAFVPVAAGKHAIIYADGTNIVRATADT